MLCHFPESEFWGEVPSCHGSDAVTASLWKAPDFQNKLDIPERWQELLSAIATAHYEN